MQTYAQNLYLCILMKQFQNIWHSPYPVLNEGWKGILVVSVIIYLLIAVLQPFGIADQVLPYKPLILISYGVVTAIVLCFTRYALPLLFPLFFDDRYWTVGKHVVTLFFNLVLIAVGNTLLSAVLFHLTLNWRLLAYFLGCVFVLAPIPVVILVMWNRNLLLKKNLALATEMNASLSQEKPENPAPKLTMLTFTGGTRESLTITEEQFIYAESEGNYLKIHFMEGGKLRQTMLRCTMLQAIEMAAQCEAIVRCHRAYLIHIDKVVKVDGNAQGYRLHLENCIDEVPVSRAYAKAVKQLLSSRT